MKQTTIINMKTTPEDRARWKANCDVDGTTMSQVMRAALDRHSARVEKQMEMKDE
jgi:hypothetical protein